MWVTMATSLLRTKERNVDGDGDDGDIAIEKKERNVEGDGASSMATRETSKTRRY
jgi:hypothetical protein